MVSSTSLKLSNKKNKHIFLFRYDSLTIYDGASSTSPMMGFYCGDSIPPSHVSSSNEILIHFEADNYNGNNYGFKMEYTQTGNTSIQNNTEYYQDYYTELWEFLHFEIHIEFFYIRWHINSKEHMGIIRVLFISRWIIKLPLSLYLFDT